MPVKEKFLAFVELQRNANNFRESHGIDAPETIEAYKRANELKRQVMDMIEELEYRMESLEK